MKCVMRFSRQIFALAILALYVAQVAGGRAAHLWQCSAGNGSCCGEVHRQAGSSPSAHHDHHGHCHHHAVEAGDERRQVEPSPGGAGRDDPSTCGVWQGGGQALDRPMGLA
ncbi:MAG: hypothetical protein ACKOUR_17920, partial [Planctomycetota bacterium]